MEKLRQKEINTFIKGLNKRELTYTKKQLKKVIDKKEHNILNFTIHYGDRIEKVKRY